MLNNLNVAIVQFDIYWNDPQKNLQYLSQQFEKYVDEAVHLIVLPEMFTTGFMAHQSHADSYSFIIGWMSSMASKYDCYLAGSIIFKEKELLYNQFICVSKEGVHGTYNKRHLFNLSDEPLLYQPGVSREIWNIEGVRILPQICYDLRFPVFSRNKNDYDVAIYTANWPSSRSLHWDTLLKARAIENQCYTIGVNRIGTDENNINYQGGSQVNRFDGFSEVLFKDEAMIKMAVLNMDDLINYRKQYPFLKDSDHFKLT